MEIIARRDPQGMDGPKKILKISFLNKISCGKSSNYAGNIKDTECG
jgi:hypothetical protein